MSDSITDLQRFARIVVAERDAAVAEIDRLRDNPVSRRMKAQRDAARAEVARLRSAVEWIERLAKSAAIEAHTRMWPVVERDWLDVLAIIERIPAPVEPSGEAETCQAIVDRVTGKPATAYTPPEDVVRPAPRRYGQCDETCTTDCGHCKGQGRPSGEAESGEGCGHPNHGAADHDCVPFAGPVPSGGQADGEDVSDAFLVDLYWRTTGDNWGIPDRIVVAFGRAVLAARPVLSREALADTLSKHRLTWWSVYPWNGGHEVAPRCTCGVLWSAGHRDDLDAQIAHWEGHLADVLAGGE